MKLTGDHCQCTACGEYFNSTAAFDKHRIGDYGMADGIGRRCRTPDVMLAVGMAKSARGFWITAARPDSSLAHTHSSGDQAITVGEAGNENPQTRRPNRLGA